MTASFDEKNISPHARYVLHLADNALIIGHRLSEWCGHGPILEQDIALSNLSLDLIGQCRLYYQYAAELISGGHDENSLAYLRSERQYYNLLLCEQPNGDFAETIVRQFFYNVYHVELLEGLLTSKDERLAAIAEKALKEVTYHHHYASEWVLRLGDGTEESHRRMQKAVDHLTPYIHEGYHVYTPWEEKMIASGVAPNLTTRLDSAKEAISDRLLEATLVFDWPEYHQKGGKQGLHSEHLGHLLAEHQYVQRAYPGMEW